MIFCLYDIRSVRFFLANVWLADLYLRSITATPQGGCHPLFTPTTCDVVASPLVWCFFVSCFVVVDVIVSLLLYPC